LSRPGQEQVLCVRRQDLFPDGVWHGFVDQGLEPYQQAIRERSLFRPRDEVEEDESYQQIIPFLVFRCRGRYFLTRRLRASTERRLRQQYSIGLGGHINASDASAGDPVEEGIRREWDEEVDYRGQFTRRLVGLINDDSSPVSRVHLALVYIVEGDSPEILIRETHKLSGELLTPHELRLHYLAMESWSQIAYDHLIGGRF